MSLVSLSDCAVCCVTDCPGAGQVAVPKAQTLRYVVTVVRVVP